MDERGALVSSWAGLASHLIGEYFDSCKHLNDKDYTGLHPLVRFVSAQLFIACHLTSESVLLLAKLDKAWDADILCRSVIEGTAKYSYILYGSDQSTWTDRCHEYWHLHPAIMLKKDCARAAKLKVQFPENGSIKNKHYKPLDDMVSMGQGYSDLWDSTTKKERKDLDNTWSFGGILEHHDSHNETNNPLKGSLYYYGLSCHQSHMDGIGIANIWGRYRREPERQAAITLAHQARIIGDISAYSKIRAITLKNACREPLEDILNIEQRYSILFDGLSAAYDNFHSVEYEESTDK